MSIQPKLYRTTARVTLELSSTQPPTKVQNMYWELPEYEIDALIAMAKEPSFDFHITDLGNDEIQIQVIGENESEMACLWDFFTREFNTRKVYVKGRNKLYRKTAQ